MYFHSRDSLCKSPFGAVTCGESVRLFVSCVAGEAAEMRLILRDDFTNTEKQTAFAACEGGFSFTFSAPDKPTLLWYHFCFASPDGCHHTFGPGGIDDTSCWQLTVYNPTQADRSWFGRGVTYQIFPDRFCRLCTPVPCSPGNRRIHECWEDAPEYLPDASGEVRNNDFFGGSLPGIISKLDYLRDLGVSTLYLNPIFTADSNHRYNTADYLSIDPMLGTLEDLKDLCAQAHARGMHIILDGVFNHTGSNSIYFNAEDSFPGPGAAQSPDSPYASWYSFHPWPDSYDAWWGIRTLPAVNENDPEYRSFIIRSEDSVIRRYLRCGVDGWRLDVADELPDDFIAEIRQAMSLEKPESFLLGEVWEDGSNKIAYDQRRRYLLGAETDGLMNYPFRTAAISFLRGGDAGEFRDTMETLRENYPPQAFYGAMNMLGTHDTPRILTALGIDDVPAEKSCRAAFRFTAEQRALALSRLKLAALLQFTFPGSPTVYYGDETAMEGFEDPFCRGTYPWDREDTALLSYYRRLGKLRNSLSSLQQGNLHYLHAAGSLLAFSRSLQGESVITVLNASDTPLDLSLPVDHLCRDLLSGQSFMPMNGSLSLTLPPLNGLLLQSK